MARGKALPNIHPGEVLVEEFLGPLGISQYRLARSLGVPLTRIAEICRGRRAITAGTALRLARFFRTSPKFWLGLQEDFDLEEEARGSVRALAKIRPHAAAPPEEARRSAGGRR